MRCRKVRSYLSAYCHDELDGRRRLAVSEHLLTCDTCRAEEAVYEQMSEALPQMEKVAISDDFNARLLDRIAHERFAETRSRAYQPKAAPLFMWRKVVPVVVTACLAVFAVIAMIPDGNNPSPMMAGQTEDLDDSYLTVQPVSNPHMTVNLTKDWSLDRQMAQAEQGSRISNQMIPASSFGGRQYHSPLAHRVSLPGQPIPYLSGQYRMRPVFKIYVPAQQGTPQKEGEKPY